MTTHTDNISNNIYIFCKLIQQYKPSFWERKGFLEITQSVLDILGSIQNYNYDVSVLQSAFLIEAKPYCQLKGAYFKYNDSTILAGNRLKSVAEKLANSSLNHQKHLEEYLQLLKDRWISFETLLKRDQKALQH